MVKPVHSPTVSLDVLPFLEVAHLQHQGVSSTGNLAYSLLTFHERGLPTPQAWVLPASAMVKIAQENHLLQVLGLKFSVLDQSDHQQMLSFSQDIAHHIKNMVLPESIARSFRRLYDNWIDHQFIAIRPSLVRTKDQSDHLSALHVRGEANIIDSLFETWAKLYLPEFLPQRLTEWREGIQAPAAFIFQIMVNAESSGVGIFTPTVGKRAANITVFSQWGITPDTQSVFRQGDWFEIDPQHWEIKQRHIGVKHHEWTRRLDELHHQAVQHRLQSHPSLTTQGAVALAKMVYTAHKGQVGACIVDWAAERNSACILDVRPFHHRPHDSGSVYFLPTAEQLKAVLPKLTTPRTYTGPTATKVYVSVGKPDQVKAQVSGADGIGLLRAEWAYQQLPAHPLHLLKAGKSELIRTNITELILHVAQFHNPEFPILFRSQNFTTNELVDFKHGKEYEPAEVNPYLGYRGAVRIIHDYTVFDIELDALQDAHLEGVQNLGLLVPFVRNHSELAIILHHFSKPEFATQRFLQLWMQANTPENTLDIEHYCMPGLSGISLNIQSIHALLHGVDPDNSDIFQLYPVHHKGIYQHLKAARQKTHTHHVKLVLQLEQFDQQLIEFASELGYDGVTVRAKDVHRARQVIIEAEHQQILS